MWLAYANRKVRPVLRSTLLVAGIAGLMGLGGAALAQTDGAPGAGQGQGAPIRLGTTTFNPSRGEAPDIPPGLATFGYAPGTSGYYIVQFDGPVAPEWREALESTGAEVMAYLPDFAFKVRMTPGQARRVDDLANIAFVGFFHPAYKLSPDIELDEAGIYRVRLAAGADAEAAIAEIAATGAEVSGQGRTLTVAADPDQLEAIANVLDVAWIETFRMNETFNEYAGVIMGADSAHTAPDPGPYDGSTQIVGVADTGIDTGLESDNHPGFGSRIVKIDNWPYIEGSFICTFAYEDEDGPEDVSSGHGTHVANSAVGEGDAVTGPGTAPGAGLHFQAIENWALLWPIVPGCPSASGFFLLGLPSDLHDLFQQSYDEGARIHSNSWGASVAGSYTVDSANTDDFVWNNPDMTITFSAGNSGVDANGDGVVDPDSIGSPSTAKNVISVGASENDRGDDFPCDPGLDYGCSGLNDIFTYGEGWPSRYPAAPINGDLSAGNAEQLAAFSSRGPTDDGRIKPDVVAPGTWVLSGYSDMYQRYYDPGETEPLEGLYQNDGWGFPESEFYKYFGGTSMSNPLVAGGAAVVRDYYQKAHSHAASAALVKATLINSAVDLLDENNDGVDDNDYPIPNNHEGWGRVDLANATDGTGWYEDVTAGLATDQSATYTFTDPESPFRVTLVWSDYPAASGAAVTLVNDLDLVVTGPGGAVYAGNDFSGGWSQAGGSADRTNNVENVYVQTAAAGTWTVEVKGYNVANGPQPYALVVDGGTADGGSGTDAAPEVTITAPTAGATVSGTVEVTADATDDDGVTQVEFFVGTGSIGIDSNGSNGWSASWDTTGDPDGDYTVSATATDTSAQTGDDSVSVEVDNVDDPPTVAITNPTDGSTVSDTVEVTADATDDDAVNQVEFFVDGGSIGIDSNGSNGWSASWDTTDDTNDSHTVSATATDTSAQTGGDSVTVTVNNTSTETGDLHIGDLDGWGAPISKGRWPATVSALVHDDGDTPVADAAISGTWLDDGSDGGCTTGVDGWCEITKPVKGNTSSVEFSVSDITGGSLGYDSGANHDPDGDSDGTTILVSQAAAGNTAPVAGFTYSCTGLTCDFTDTSTDDDGTINSRSWNFGDGNTSTAQDPSHTYAAEDNYTVALTVVDNDDSSDSDSQTVSVSEDTSGDISLSVNAYKDKGTQTAALPWSGTGSVDLYWDGIIVPEFTSTTVSPIIHSTGQKGGGSATYKVCEPGEPSICSDEVTATW